MRFSPAFAVLAAAMIAACGGEHGSSPLQQPEQASPPAVVLTSVAVASPPAARATAPGRSAAAATGSYCWRQAGSAPFCRDMLSPVTGIDSLPVAPGDTVLLETGFSSASISEVVVTAFDVTGLQGKPLGGAELTWDFPPVGGAPLPAQRSVGGVTFQAEVTAGRYVIAVFLRVPQGDVTYGLLVDVR